MGVFELTYQDIEKSSHWYKESGFMADVLTKEQRHKNMKNIHGKDTKIEINLRKALWAKGYR